MLQSGRLRLIAYLFFASALLVAACQRASAPAAPPQPQLRPDQARLLAQALDGATADGFRPGAFAPPGLEQRLRGGDPAAEKTLVQGALAYARAMHGLSIPASQKPQEWALRPPAYDAEADFRQALAQDRLKDWLASLAPPSPRYAALRAAYQQYLKILAGGGWPQLQPGRELRQGDQGPDVQALRRRLSIEDASLQGAPPDAPYDDQLAAAVQRAQTRYGLKPTGIAGADLVKALNVPADARAAQIRANLERLRWLPRDPSPTRIEVNTAAGVMDLFENGAPAMHMLAAAGKPDDQTPMLVSAVNAIQFNPAWHVPDDIAKKELYPKERRDRGYFARSGFTTRDGQLVQEPGPKNALGQVKFEFPNSFEVYMHDTPSRSAFASAHRSVSHGCVRLERAVDLANRLLADVPDWGPDRVDQTLASDDTTTVKLPDPVPVGLYYLTAFPDPDGSVSFRDDVYGWDAELLRLLDAGPARHA